MQVISPSGSHAAIEQAKGAERPAAAPTEPRAPSGMEADRRLAVKCAAMAHLPKVLADQVAAYDDDEADRLRTRLALHPGFSCNGRLDRLGEAIACWQDLDADHPKAALWARDAISLAVGLRKDNSGDDILSLADDILKFFARNWRRSWATTAAFEPESLQAIGRFRDGAGSAIGAIGAIGSA